MCRLVDTSRAGQCDHDRTDPPAIKEIANFCEYFAPDANSYNGKSTHALESAKPDFDALFAGEAEGDSGSACGSAPRLDDLFDD